jgi:GNAT superfamily N-acetyltransferase
VPGFSLAFGWMLLRRPGLLRSGTLRQAAADLVVAALVPVTLVAAALALALLDWPLNMLVSGGLLSGDSVLLAAAAAARGAVWVLDGWGAGVMVTLKEPWEGRPRFEAAQYWALPPGRGRGRRLRDEGIRLADRFGVVLEQEAINSHLARRIYRRAGFEIVAGSEERRRPTMRRAPSELSESTRPPLATGDGARTSGQ